MTALEQRYLERMPVLVHELTSTIDALTKNVAELCKEVAQLKQEIKNKK